jgi:hypothetical protein
VTGAVWGLWRTELNGRGGSAELLVAVEAEARLAPRQCQWHGTPALTAAGLEASASSSERGAHWRSGTIFQSSLNEMLS